jgi:hypothetical protein
MVFLDYFKIGYMYSSKYLFIQGMHWGFILSA